MSDKPEYKLRKTKIVATLGPATDSPEAMEALLLAGINVVRLNFSHGTHQEQKKRIDLVRETAKRVDRTIGILADLQGPKIRVSRFVNGFIELEKGDHFVLSASHDECEGNQNCVGIDYKELPNDVMADDILLLDDGRLRFKVLRVEAGDIHCEVLNPGKLSNNKGINRLGGGLNAKALTEKDMVDLKFSVELDVDYIAISFPRDANDINQARQLMNKFNGNAGIIAKIERAEAVTCIDDIINAADGVMVARGDLAVEIGQAEVPLVQKEIVRSARALDKPVIVATQMLESMIQEPVPTRAEVSDVANAVLDHADAVMLSAETAVGRYPIESVKMMSNICLHVEQQPDSQISKHRVECHFSRADEAVAMAAMYMGNHMDVVAVVALTESGASTLWMSRIRTALPIIGMSRFARALGKMALYRGVYPIEFDVTGFDRGEINSQAVLAVQKKGWVHDGDRMILTKGDNLGVGGGTNAVKILEVGDVK